MFLWHNYVLSAESAPAYLQMKKQEHKGKQNAVYSGMTMQVFVLMNLQILFKQVQGLRST